MFKLASLLSLVGLSACAQVDPAKAAKAENVYRFEVKTIAGEAEKLEKYKGKVLLIVNVASKCGLTPQYAGLQALYEKYKDRGLVVLGFPANDFMGQEPGTNEEIKQFCETNYKVSFPMFAKISVGGSEPHELYQWLIVKSGRNDAIEWNFAKFLVSADGKTVQRFTPKTKPDDPEFIKKLEATLGK